MADNVVTSAAIGTGITLATDDIASTHYQRVKLSLGGDGVANDAVAGAGVVGTGVQRVTLASDDPGVASLALIDNVIYVDDAAWTGDTSSHALIGGIYQSTPQTITDGRTGPILLDANGRLIVKAAANAGVTIGAVEIAAAQTLATVTTVTTVGAVTAITNALPAGTNAIGKLAANSGVDIGDVDVTSIVPGTAATNLGKAEDAAHSSGDVGVMALSVRQDTAAALGGTDADYQPLITDASGRLHVNVGNTVTVGSHAVTNAGTFAVQATLAAGAATIAKAEDVASADADVGVPAMAVRKATPANTSGTDGDYEFLQMSAGRLWTSTVVDTALPAGTNNIGDVDILSIAAGDNNIGNVDVVTLPATPAGTNLIGRIKPEGDEYETVAASQTAQALGATGGTGDYIAGVLVIPATTSPGQVKLLDNATEIVIFEGGASSVSNLVPFLIPLGLTSVSGAWKLTTGANLSAIGIGNFT